MTTTLRRLLPLFVLILTGSALLHAQTVSKRDVSVLSTTLTATGNSLEQQNDVYKGVSLTLNVSASSGTGQTLDAKVQGFDLVSGQWVDVSGAVFQRLTGTGTRTLVIYPSPEGRGNLRSITGTDPAAGVEITEAVPANTRWNVLGVGFSLVTSATVNNRVVNLAYDDGTNVYARMSAAFNQAAGLTDSYGAQPSSPWSNSSALAIQIPLPVGTILSGGHRFKTATQLLDVGDNYSAPQYLVEEWIGNYAAMPLPRVWRVVSTIAGSSPSFTFTVAGSYLP